MKVLRCCCCCCCCRGASPMHHHLRLLFLLLLLVSSSLLTCCRGSGSSSVEEEEELLDGELDFGKNALLVAENDDDPAALLLGDAGNNDSLVGAPALVAGDALEDVSGADAEDEEEDDSKNSGKCGGDTTSSCREEDSMAAEGGAAAATVVAAAAAAAGPSKEEEDDDDAVAVRSGEQQLEWRQETDRSTTTSRGRLLRRRKGRRLGGDGNDGGLRRLQRQKRRQQPGRWRRKNKGARDLADSPASCSSYSGCVNRGLTGSCCPTRDGVYLGCCFEGGGGGGGSSEPKVKALSSGNPRLEYVARDAEDLGECQGDCDSDRDCRGNLVCFKRSNYESVPGCSGRGSSGADYCVRSTTGGGGNHLEYIARDAEDLGECQGDCDSDSDCRGSLVCFKRSGYESVPGCSGSGNSGTDYCIKSTGGGGDGGGGGNRLEYVARDAEDLGECQGDCDSDWDCRGNLICFKRSGYESVPGCPGRGSSGTDYCIKSPSSSGDVFRLKLYWEEGYGWQDQDRELKYCLECERRCDWGEEVEVHRCDSRDNAYWQFRNKSGGGRTQIQLYRTNLCMELVGSRRVELRNCVDSKSSQTFRSGPDGDFGGRRFELVTSNDGCLTMHHHPRSGEAIYRNSCSQVRSRSHRTSYWNKY